MLRARCPAIESFTAGFLMVIAAAALFVAGCGGTTRKEAAAASPARIDPPPIAADLQAELETWLAAHGRPPAEYVLGLFDTRAVVILGEQHRIRHDVEFVRDLVPRLPAAGVRVLATEFARRVDQPLLDSLLAAPAWDEALGREILFRQFVPWGYREYLDVLKAAWSVNRSLPSGAPPFRVIGVNNVMDVSHFRTEEDWNDPARWDLVMGGQTEADWAKPVLDVVAAGGKVLAHCGIHHAFSGYRQPRVKEGAFIEFADPRFGNHLRDALGDRAATVYLHAPWNGPGGYADANVHPAGGRLDAFMLARAGGPFPVGFTVAGSPLAGLPIENTVYRLGHEPFAMGDFCDGWIYMKPVGEFEPVAYIEGWIHEGNLEQARALSMNPRMRDDTLAEMDAACRSYLDDFRRFYGRLR